MVQVGVASHTGERAAILKLHFHEFDEKELLRAEFLGRPCINARRARATAFPYKERARS